MKGSGRIALRGAAAVGFWSVLSTAATPGLDVSGAPTNVPVTSLDLRQERSQNSPALARHPRDSRLLALASRVDAPEFSCALHMSGDGGRSWQPARPVVRLPGGAERCYAPEVAFAPDGVLHYLFAGLHTPGNVPMGIFLTSSRDAGRSFSVPRRVLGPHNYMARLAIDHSFGKTGRLHLVWLKATSDPPLGGLPPPPNPILSAYSDDGGAHFSKPVRVNHPGRQRVVAPALSIGPEGRVHVVHYDLRDDVIDYQGLEGPAWEGTWTLALSTSRDRGASFDRHAVINDEIVPPERVMLIFTMAPAALAAAEDGSLSASWTDGRNGDWDVLLSRRRAEGRPWSDPIRLNDDPERNGRHQYLPRLAIAPHNRLDAIFYDRRGGPGNARNHVFLTSSLNGRSFSQNKRISSEPSPVTTGPRYPVPSARGLVDFGSRLALDSEDTGTLAAWTDTRLLPPGFTQQDVVAARVTRTTQNGIWQRRFPTVLVLFLVIGAAVFVIASRRRRRRLLDR